MTRWRRTAWWVAGSLTACLLVGGFLAHSLINQEHIKSALQSRATELWSLDLAIGDLSLQLFPAPALRASNLTLTNPGWTERPQLLAAGEVSARLSLLPLLGGQLVVSTLIVDDLQLNLDVADDGRSNWMQMTDPTDANGHMAAAGLTDLATLRIRHANVTYRAPNALKIWKLERLNVHAKPSWTDVQVDAEVLRNNYPLRIAGKFSDLSGLGAKGAVTQGALTAHWHQATLTVSGLIPLESQLRGQDLHLALDADSLNGLLGFFDMRRGTTAPVRANVHLQETDGLIRFKNLSASLGAFTMQGSGQLDLSKPRPRLEARLTGDRLDWAQAQLDAGQPPLPPKRPHQIFRDNPLAWPLLAALDGTDGRMDISLDHLRLRSGIEVTQAKAKLALGKSGLTVGAFSGRLLDGTVDGAMHLDAQAQKATLAFEAKDVSLARGLDHRKKKLTDGKMSMRGYLSSSGSSLKQLAAKVSGPLVLRLGPMKVNAPGAQKAETFFHALAPAFSTREANHVDVACASARLLFSSGLAHAEPVLGLRTDASQLLASGNVDLRDESLDLRGRLKARSGISLGLSMLSDSVRISGKILKPALSLDPAGAPEALARIGAAIVSGGASVLATAMWDAANPQSDPCRTVAADTAIKPPAGWPSFPAVAPLILARE